MKRFLYLSVCFYTAYTCGMTVNKRDIQKLSAEERARLMAMLQQADSQEETPSSEGSIHQRSFEDSETSDVRQTSDTPNRSPRTISSASSAQRQGEDKKLADRKVASSSSSKAEKKSPRKGIKLPRLRLDKDDIRQRSEDFEKMLQVLRSNGTTLSEKYVQQIINKADTRQLLDRLLFWIRSNPSLVPLAGYQQVIKAVIVFSGYTQASRENLCLDAPLFVDILDLVETYAVQQLVSVKLLYPENESSRELSKILEVAINQYPADVELMLCRRMRLAIKESQGEHALILRDDLRAILSGAHSRTDKMLKGQLLKMLRALVVKNKGLPADEVILAAFMQVYGGKVEDSLYGTFRDLAQAADRESTMKRKGIYKELLEDWAAKDGNNLYMSTISFDIMRGLCTERVTPDEVLIPLDSYGLDRTIELPLLAAAESMPLALNKTLKSGKSDGNDDSTYTSTLKSFAAMKQREKALLVGIPVATEPVRVDASLPSLEEPKKGNEESVNKPLPPLPQRAKARAGTTKKLEN